MGMYTGFKLDVELKVEGIDQWGPILKAMLSRDLVTSIPISHIPPHPLFNTKRWRYLLTGTSVYMGDKFPTNSFLKANRLSCCSSIKDYDGEIELFLDFLSPFIENFHSGAYQYEEEECERPINYKDGKLIISSIRSEEERSV